VLQDSKRRRLSYLSLGGDGASAAHSSGSARGGTSFGGPAAGGSSHMRGSGNTGARGSRGTAGSGSGCVYMPPGALFGSAGGAPSRDRQPPAADPYRGLFAAPAEEQEDGELEEWPEGPMVLPPPPPPQPREGKRGGQRAGRLATAEPSQAGDNGDDEDNDETAWAKFEKAHPHGRQLADVIFVPAQMRYPCTS